MIIKKFIILNNKELSAETLNNNLKLLDEYK
jgi:hypothetical protein